MADYDPYAQREGLHMTTNFETFVHLVKSSLGTGLLAMPMAFRHSGLLFGIACTALLGSYCVYGLHLLIDSMYIVCKKREVPTLPFAEAVKGAMELGPPAIRRLSCAAVYIVEFFLVAYHGGICCAYIVYVGDSIKQVVEQGGDFQVTPVAYRAGVAFLLLFLNQIRNLKLLAPVSLVATIAMGCGLGIIFSYIFQDLPSFDSLPLFANVAEWPLFIGTVLFALESIGVVISLENNMHTPQSYTGICGILNAGMAVVLSLYCFIGFFGYLKYGDSVHPVITFNLPEGEGLGKTVKIIYALAIFLTYPLQIWPLEEIFWDKYLTRSFVDPGGDKCWIWETVFRILIVVITFIIAAAIPNVGFIISLIGCFCLSMLGIAFPAVMEICVLYPDDYGALRWRLYKDILIAVSGVLALIFGLYATFMDILG